MPASREEFEDYVDKLEMEALGLWIAKNEEYAGENQFENFEELARSLGVSPEYVVLVFAHKHFRSIQQAVRSGNYGHRVESIRGRVLDLSNYLRVLGFMMEARAKEQQNKALNHPVIYLAGS